MNYTDYLGKTYNPETQEFSPEEAHKKAVNEKDTINILLIGASGVGKSTLVNAVFGVDMAKTGVGKPVTQNLECYEIPSKGLTLWDTKGIESAAYEETFKDLKSELKKSVEAAAINRTTNLMPHVAWLLIKEPSARVEEREFELVKLVYEEFKIPVVVVFTQTQFEAGDKFVEEAKALFNEKHEAAIDGRYVRINSSEYTFMGQKIPKSGLDDLLELTENAIPEGKINAKKALTKAQIVNSKKRLAAMIDSSKTKVHVAAAAAGVAGLSPIPMSDAPIIAAIQSTMIYTINAEFEVDSEISNTSSAVMGILGVTAVANVGKTIVSNLFKLIPGPGSFLGGAISGATAATLTEAVGHAYIAVLEKYYDAETGQVVLPKDTKTVLNTFKTIFKQP